MDLTKVFTKYGSILGQALTQRIKDNKSADNAGTPYPPLKASTLKGTPERKGKRLVNTGEFSTKTFSLDVQPLSLSVFVKEGEHSKGVTYADIIRYHDRNSGDVNKKIYKGIQAPVIVPEEDFDVEAVEGMGNFRQDLLSLAEAQLSYEMPGDVEVTMRVSL